MDVDPTSDPNRTDDGGLAHDAALLMLMEHLGEPVYASLSMATDAIAGGPFSVMRMQGRLGHASTSDVGPGDAVATFRDIASVTFTIDDEAIMLPPLPGIVRQYEMGLEWVLAEGLTLRINWGGGG
jgi:hypothetical protein